MDDDNGKDEVNEAMVFYKAQEIGGTMLGKIQAKKPVDKGSNWTEMSAGTNRFNDQYAYIRVRTMIPPFGAFTCSDNASIRKLTFDLLCVTGGLLNGFKM